MLPIYAAWKWYSAAQNEDAFACAAAYTEKDIYTSQGFSGPQDYMYGVNHVCAQEQRGNLMDAAAACINANGGNCRRSQRPQPDEAWYCPGGSIGGFPNYCGTIWKFDDVDNWDCSGFYTTAEVIISPHYVLSSRENVTYGQYFVFTGAGEDKCSLQLKARKDMATGAVLDGAACQMHDVYGIRPPPSGNSGCIGCTTAQIPGYFAQGVERNSDGELYDRSAFWDGVSQADYSYSQLYGVELPAFEGSGYQDGQGPYASRAQACTNSFDFGQRSHVAFAMMAFGSSIDQRVDVDGQALAAAISAQKYDGYMGQTMNLRTMFAMSLASGSGQIIKSELDRLRVDFVDKFQKWTSDPNEKVFFIKAQLRDLPSDSDVMLADVRRYPINEMYETIYPGNTESVTRDAMSGRHKAGLSQTEFLSLYDGCLKCLDEAFQFLDNPNTCESIQFTRSVWRGVAPAGQQPGWVCIEDLGDGYTPQAAAPDPPSPPSPPPRPPRPPSPPPPSSPSRDSCQGDSSTWNAGYGSCSTYGPGAGNEAWCDSDSSGDLFAQDVCEECGQCARSRRQLRQDESHENDKPAIKPAIMQETLPDEKYGHRALEAEEASVEQAFAEAVLGHKRRLRHGCANSRSGCRVLPPPRR